MAERDHLPGNWRRMSIEQRRAFLKDNDPQAFADLERSAALPELLRLSEIMIENSVGFFPVPLGVADGFLINRRPVAIPMATEEPSVVAAACFGARLAAAEGGFIAEAAAPVMEGAVYLENVDEAGRGRICNLPLRQLIDQHRLVHPGIYSRGGGIRSFQVKRLHSGTVRVAFSIDVCDAMGANIINTAVETLAPLLAGTGKGGVLMAILSNSAPHRLVSARCRVPLRRLARGGFTGEEMGDRIQRAWRIAEEDPSRAVTHNKGIMNGITALCIATGNDSRSLEAAVHAYAAQGGYTPVSGFQVEEDMLCARIKLPLPLGVVGGAVSIHPGARFALNLCGCQSAGELGEIAASLGLAQNLAALAALVGEGIQKGHMRLHAYRVAMQAGAIGAEVDRVASRIAQAGSVSLDAAMAVLQSIRNPEGNDSG